MKLIFKTREKNNQELNKYLLYLHDLCKFTTGERVTYTIDLIADQEKADTKTILHIKHSLDESRNNIVQIVSLLWDTDAVILVGALLLKVLDEGRGKKKISIMLLS